MNPRFLIQKLKSLVHILLKKDVSPEAKFTLGVYAKALRIETQITSATWCEKNYVFMLFGDVTEKVEIYIPTDASIQKIRKILYLEYKCGTFHKKYLEFLVRDINNLIKDIPQTKWRHKTIITYPYYPKDTGD